MLLILAHMKRCSSPPMRYKGSYVPECIPTLSFRRLSGMWGILKCWEAFMSARALSATTAAWVRWRRFGRPATSIYVSPIVSTCGQESGGLSVSMFVCIAIFALHCSPQRQSMHACTHAAWCSSLHSTHFVHIHPLNDWVKGNIKLVQEIDYLHIVGCGFGMATW